MKRVGIVAQHVSAQQEYDLIIRNGTIFDGLKTPRFVSDIGIKDGKTATIGRIAKGAVCKKEIDATGKNVCPGFIDGHTHYDAQIFWDPYLTLSGWHGVTSMVLGNCGFGYAPCKPEGRERAMKTMERTEAVPYEAQEKGMPWDWETFPEFMDSLDRTPKGVNLQVLQALSPLMSYVMGVENAKNRPATKEEMEKMKGLLRDAMACGGAGFGAQILGSTSVQRDYDGTPMITDTMAKEDLYAFGSVLAEFGRGFMQVAGPSRKTCENLAKASGRPILYNAITPDVDQHGQKTENASILMKWFEECNTEKGLRIYGQAITTMNLKSPQCFSLDIFNLFDASPPWRRITLGDPSERMLKMRDPKHRQDCRDQFDNPNKTVNLNSIDRSKGADKEQDGGLGLSLRKLVLDSTGNAENQKYVGMILGEIAEAREQHVVDCFLDVSLEDDLKANWRQQANPSNVANLKAIANHPYTFPGVSDGGAHTKFITAGDFSTDFLVNLVRDNDGMSLEDAHWRLSKYTATAAAMEDRGQIAVGMPADVIVYDMRSLRVMDEEIAYDFPGGEWRRIRRAEGYDYTIVNGVITFEGNRCTGATPGRVLRHGRAQDML